MKKIGAKIISIHGDSKLIIKQIKLEYSAKHPILRAYKIVVLDFIEGFVEYDLSTIPRNQNILANSLSFSASTCQMPHPSWQYIVEVKHQLTLPHNVRYWQVFGNDKQIENFRQSKDEFEEDSIDVECDLEDKIVVHSDLEN